MFTICEVVESGTLLLPLLDCSFSGQPGPVQHVLLQSPKPGSAGSGSGATVLQPSQLSQQSTPPTIAPKPSPVQSKPTSSPSQSAVYTQGIFAEGKFKIKSIRNAT